MQKYLFALCIFLTVSIVSAQNVKVINAHTNNPLDEVLVLSNNFILETKADGIVNLSQLQDSSRIIFRHASFKTYRTTKRRIRQQNNVVLLLENPVNIEEVVISVNRWKQSTAEIPQTVQSIHSSELLLSNEPTSADLLSNQSGVFMQKSQMGGGSPMIRGFAANRILLVVDGIRMNNAIYRSGNLHNIISVDANSLSSVEVIYGPGSVIYGSDALGGVISFNTLNNKLTTLNRREREGKLLTRFSSANREKTLHTLYSFNDQKWGSIFTATFSDFGNMVMGQNGREEYLRNIYVKRKNNQDLIITNKNNRVQKFTGYNQFNLMGKIRYRPSNIINSELSIYHSQTSNIPRYDRLVLKKDQELKYADWYYGPQNWTMVALKTTVNQPKKLYDNLSVLTGFQQYKESRHDRKLHSQALRSRYEKVYVYSINLDFNKKLSGTQKINYGFEFYYNKVFSSGKKSNIFSKKEEKIASRYPNNSNYLNGAGYASYQFNLSKKLMLQSGLRYTATHLSGKFNNQFYHFPFDDFNSTNQALIGNAGVVWRPTPTWQINLNASTGFRSPNIDDFAKVFDSEPGNIIVPNLNLQPEYARNIELSIHKTVKEKAKIELSLFYTRLSDAMVRRDFQLNGKDSILYDGVMSKVNALINVESATIYGSTINAKYLFSPFFRAESSFTIIKGEDADKQSIRHIAPPFGVTHLIYENRKFFIDVFSNYSSGFSFEQLATSEKNKPHIYATDSNGNPFSPDWWTLNASVSYFINNQMHINVGVDNILDKRYRTYSSGVVASGLNLKAAVSYQF